MQKAFDIYIDRLKGGHEEEIHETVPSSFLELKDKELSFSDTVEISGNAYLAEHELIIRLQVEAEAFVPCTICNELVKIPVHIQDFYLTAEIRNIKSGIFNYGNELRESVLLEVPLYAECNNGKCPERETLNKYLKKTE